MVSVCSDEWVEWELERVKQTLELIKRGHRLVTDDVQLEIRKVSDDTLVGSAPDITRHFIELRGIGIVDVKSMFGVQSVRESTEYGSGDHAGRLEQEKGI